MVKHHSRKHKKVKPRNAKDLTVFSTSFNHHGPKFNKIINRHINLLLNNDNLKEFCSYGKCSYKDCDSCSNFVDETIYIKCNANGRKYKIRRNTSYNSKNVIYVAYCIKYMKGDVGLTTFWKPCLSNCKIHVRKKKLICRIVRYFIEISNDNRFNNLRFTIIHWLNNVYGLTNDEKIDLLLIKEKFWIGTLVTKNQGLNSKQDLNRKKRCERKTLNH